MRNIFFPHYLSGEPLNNDKGDKVSNDNIISLIAFKF